MLGFNHIADANYLAANVYNSNQNTQKGVLISEKPPALNVASQTQQDWERWNLKGDDLIQQLNHPNLISEQKYQESARNGQQSDRLPYGKLDKSTDYLMRNYSGDYQILIKQGADLPIESQFLHLKGIENKQHIKPNMYRDFWNNSYLRQFERRDHATKLEGIVPLDHQKTKPPLLSPDIHSITVPKNVEGVLTDERYELGQYYANQPNVEKLITPNVFLDTERKDMIHRINIASGNINRFHNVQSMMSVHAGLLQPLAPIKASHPNTSSKYDGNRMIYAKDVK